MFIMKYSVFALRNNDLFLFTYFLCTFTYIPYILEVFSLPLAMVRVSAPSLQEKSKSK